MGRVVGNEHSYVEKPGCCGFRVLISTEPWEGGGILLPQPPIDSDFCSGIVRRKCISRPYLQCDCLQKPASQSNIDSSVSAYKQI